MDKGVIVYICDSKGVRDIYEADGAGTIAASEPLVVLVCPSIAWKEMVRFFLMTTWLGVLPFRIDALYDSIFQTC
jgi:hypothetical protein